MRDYACGLPVRDGRVLLGRRAAHRRAYAGKWDVIGGLVEAGESVEAALVRELGEELGIVPVEWTALGGVVDAGPEARGVATYHMFAVRGWTGEVRMANDEHSALEWFRFAEAGALEGLALEEYRALFGRLAAAVGG